MSARKNKIAFNGEQTRDNILEVARAHFAAKGFQQSSMRDIAAELNIRPSAIYYYFDNKSCLFYSILAAFIAKVDEIVRDIMEVAPHEPETLYVVSRVHVILNHQLHADFILYASREKHLGDAHLAALAQAESGVRALYQTYMESLQADGRVRLRNPAIAAAILLATINDVHRWYDPDGSIEIEVIADELVDALQSGWGPPSNAPRMTADAKSN